jgi:hypothetical protein
MKPGEVYGVEDETWIVMGVEQSRQTDVARVFGYNRDDFREQIWTVLQRLRAIPADLSGRLHPRLHSDENQGGAPVSRSSEA